MKKYTYVGPHEKLKGKTALGQVWDLNRVSVQFDDTGLFHPLTGIALGFRWHYFPIQDFEEVSCLEAI